MSPPTIPLPNGHSALLHRSHPPSQLSNVITSHHVPHRTPFKVDLHSVKQELHDALGDNGLPYWKALNGYLLGQVGRGEMEDMVRGWLKGSKVHLHNKLLTSLLHNASISTHASTPSSPLSLRKRKRVGPEDPDFDTDEVYVEPKSRVHHWLMGINRKEGGRVKRAVMKQTEEEEKEGDGWGETRQKLGVGVQQNNIMPPLAATERSLPSSHQLSHRLSQLAKAYDLSLSPDALSDIGEFLAIGMDAHLSDVLYALVHFTGRDRPGGNTVRIPTGTKQEDPDIDIKVENGEVPKPDLEILRDLFTLNPSLHASTSPALYKLASNITLAESEYNSPPVKVERKPSPPPAGLVIGADIIDDRVGKLVEAGLVKIDNIKKDGEDGGKKDRKHNLHWKYEDPALILKSVLG